MNPIKLFLLVQLVNGTPCHICGTKGNGAIKFPHVVLQNVGKTCTQIALSTALNVEDKTPECTQRQKEWNSRCCDPNKCPAGTTPSGLKPQQVPKVDYKGPYEPCDVCRDGDYPYKTSMVINLLYTGVGSCAQYYIYGKEGKIMTHLCSALQYYAYEPCGCGKFNPHFKSIDD